MNQDSRNEEIYSAYLDDLREYGTVNWERIADSIPHIDLSLRHMRRISRKLYHARSDGKEIVKEIKEFADLDTPPEEHDPIFIESKNEPTATASSYNDTVTSLEKLLVACDYYKNGYDKQWKVKQHIVNTWGKNWQVKAWFSPKEEYPLASAVNDIIDKFKDHVPNYTPPKALGIGGEYLFVPSIYDAHINKMSVNGRYTLEQAVRDFKAAAEGMVARALSMRMPIKEVLFVIGQDALHADNLIGTTTQGTWMDIAAAQRRGINAVCEAVIHATETFATVAPVKVVTIEGNHDAYSTYWLGKVVSAWFRNNPHVTVDEIYSYGNATPRKYYQFGNVLLGLDHGNNVKPEHLALTMAVEAPQQWAATKYREFLRGHFHKRLTLFHQIVGEKGVNIRVLPALCPTDEWHLMKGFIGNERAADALFYHEEYGQAGMFPVFVDELID